MTKLQVISGRMVASFYTPGPLFLAFSTHSPQWGASSSSVVMHRNPRSLESTVLQT